MSLKMNSAIIFTAPTVSASVLATKTLNISCFPQLAATKWTDSCEFLWLKSLRVLEIDFPLKLTTEYRLIKFENLFTITVEDEIWFQAHIIVLIFPYFSLTVICKLSIASFLCSKARLPLSDCITRK